MLDTFYDGRPMEAAASDGYRCYLVADLERPFAIAIMTNSEVGTGSSAR